MPTIPVWFTQGGLLMWPLLVCSLLLVTVTLERLCYWWRLTFRFNTAAIDACLSLLARQQIVAARQEAEKSKDPALLMLNQAFNSPTIDTIPLLLGNAANHQLSRMRRGQSVLDTIITLAPMLGILGTVIGIIQSFQVLGGSNIDDPAAVIGGIAQALVTTAAGLSVAVMALLPFNYFRSKVQEQALRLEQVGSHVEALLTLENEPSEKPAQLKAVSHEAG